MSEKSNMLGRILAKIADFSLEVLRVLYDLAEKLSGEASQEWLVELKKFLRKEKCWISIILKLISGDESLILDAVDGTETLAEAEDVFFCIDSDFKKHGADEKGPATEEVPVKVYEVVNDATYAQMFGSLNSDADRLCLTQHQIKNFVRKYRDWLRKDGYATLFLFKSGNHFFVANVFFISEDKLKVFARRFKSDDVWDGVIRRRVVVPQLA